MIACNRNHSEWRLINYRSIRDAVSAEFLHDLYNRHRPEINSLRFRNTISVYDGTEFSSYAPAEEWDRLARLLGKRFLGLEDDLLCRIDEYIAYGKPRLMRLLGSLEAMDAVTLDGEALAYAISSLHYTALGEIYGVNLVQLEHASAWAIRQRMFALGMPGTEADWLHAEESTMAVLEESCALEWSIDVSEGILNLEAAGQKHDDRFASLAHGYGASGLHGRSGADRIASLLGTRLEDRRARLSVLTHPRDRTRSPRGENDPVLRRLSEAAIGIGMLRDRNKALMGRVSKCRNALFDAAVVLTGVGRDDLSRYLLSEIEDLLLDGIVLSAEDVRERHRKMVFERRERAVVGPSAKAAEMLLMQSGAASAQDRIHGVCASLGTAFGTIRHVRSAADAERVTDADIMVAKGTDFDMLQAMMRCAGVVTEEGGLLSHASVVTREIGKPCLIGVSGALSRLPHGSPAELDASAGHVRLIGMPSPRPRSRVISLADAVSPEMAGHKAYRLSNALKYGFPVLPGAVITTGVRGSERQDAEPVLEILRLQGVADGDVLLRSSSVAEDLGSQSSAGMFKSVRVGRTASEIEEGLAEVIASAGSAHVASYLKCEDRPEMAVLAQPYLEQDIGGVAFSRDPVGGADEIVIEASAFGAERVVAGSMDSLCRIDRRDIPEQRPAGEAATPWLLTAWMCLRAESAFGHPVDIEWGVSQGRWYLFQVRPITSI